MTLKSRFLEEKKAVVGPPLLQPAGRLLQKAVLQNIFFHSRRSATKMIQDTKSFPIASLHRPRQPPQPDHPENIFFPHGNVGPGRNIKKSGLRQAPAA